MKLSLNPILLPKLRKIPLLIATIALAMPLVLLKAADEEKGTDDSTSVAAAKVVREDLYQVQTLEGEFRPYQEIDLHAKVAGFVDKINVDIGDRVKDGQLIAKLEVPELEDDLEFAKQTEMRSEEEIEQSKADSDRAQAAYEDAHLSYTRLLATHKAQPKLIAQQDLDAARARDKSTQAQVASSRVAITTAQLRVKEAKTNIKKLETMIQYTSITAPFDGVVTKRYADEGALIQAGTSSSTQAMPLVRLSENGRLRLVFHVSESFAAKVQPGTAVEFQVGSLDKVYQGTVARIARKIDTSTRTMDAEVDVPNPNLELIPGMYVSVRLKLNPRNQVLSVPVEAVSRQDKTTVYLINNEQKVEEREVKLGLETPTKVEVLSGLHENDLVMIGSRTQVRLGQKVEVKLLGGLLAP